MIHPKIADMKTKTLIELITLSSSIYYLAKDTQLLEKIKELSEKGMEHINKTSSEVLYDENGHEIQFMDKVILQTKHIKEDLEEEIEALVAKFYKKLNIAHLDEISSLNEKLEKSNTEIALLEARLNLLETQL